MFQLVTTEQEAVAAVEAVLAFSANQELVFLACSFCKSKLIAEMVAGSSDFLGTKFEIRQCIDHVRLSFRSNTVVFFGVGDPSKIPDSDIRKPFIILTESMPQDMIDTVVARRTAVNSNPVLKIRTRAKSGVAASSKD